MLVHCERLEMCTMSRSTEISRNVWLGSTADSGLDPTVPKPDSEYDILIEASDLAQSPTPDVLQQLVERLDETGETQLTEFSSSGSIMPHPLLQDEVDGILDNVKWLYETANGEVLPEDEEILTDSEGDSNMAIPSPVKKPRKVLIHCADGYTETSLLALAYIMYAEGLSAHDAWLALHCEKQRNFFAYMSDLSLLVKIEPDILRASPRADALSPKNLSIGEPGWLHRMDGSLPSRILPYMYLGNLVHANNPDLLKAMGIKRILSVGESVSWTEQEENSWGAGNVMFIDRVQDNGVDPLWEEFDRCLQFIGKLIDLPCHFRIISNAATEKGKKDGGATLVHCRVGVSRSATICIAEVMRSKGLSFPRA